MRNQSNWSNLLTFTNVASSTNFMDTDATDFNRRFYRVISPRVMKAHSLLAITAFGGLFLLMGSASAQTWTLTTAPVMNWSSIACSADGSKLVAAVEGGGIYTSPDFGGTWALTSAPLTNWWAVASSADGTKLFATGNGGGIYCSSDSGVTWMPTTAPVTNWTSVACSADGTKALAVAAGSMRPLTYGAQPGPVYTSSDSGMTWSVSSAPVARWIAVAISADGAALMAVEPFGICVSKDSGATWFKTNAIGYTMSIACSADGRRLVLGSEDPIHMPYGGPVSVSTNCGAVWNWPMLYTEGRGSVATSADGDRLVAAGGPRRGVAGRGLIFTSLDGGDSWATVSAPVANWTAVASSADGSKLVGLVGGGGIYSLEISAPIITSDPASQIVLAGATVNFTPGLIGAGSLAYQWQFNGADLAGATNRTLTLTNVHLSDSGAYVVTVSNAFGRASSSSALLAVLPFLVITQPPSSVSTTGAVLNAQITPGSNRTLAWFEWGTDNHYGRTTPLLDFGTNFGSFNSSLTGLTPATPYHFRVVASNALGTATGADVSFVTDGLPLVQTSAPLTNWSALASSADGSKLVAAASPGRVYVSTNAGDSWTPTSAPLTNWQAVASSLDGTKLVAAAYGGSIHTSTDAGANWARTSAPSTNWISVASSANGSRLVASCWGGLIYISVDAGTNWMATTAPFMNWRAVATSADGTKLVAVTLGAGIYTSTNSGASWTETTAPFANWLSVASSADGSRLVAGINYGDLYISVNGGATWVDHAVLGNWTSIASSADGSRLVAGYGNGPIYASTDAGANWAARAPTGYWTAVASSADGGKLVGAAGGEGIYVAQSTPAPELRLRRLNGAVILSWTVPSLPFVLQENSDWTTTNWVDAPGTPALNAINLQHQVTLPLAISNRFYRLKH